MSDDIGKHWWDNRCPPRLTKKDHADALGRIIIKGELGTIPKKAYADLTKKTMVQFGWLSRDEVLSVEQIALQSIEVARAKEAFGGN